MVSENRHGHTKEQRQVRETCRLSAARHPAREKRADRAIGRSRPEADIGMPDLSRAAKLRRLEGTVSTVSLGLTALRMRLDESINAFQRFNLWR